jgi:hypothetical protein
MTIGLKAKATIAYIPSSEQKQYLSSVLSSLRNNTKLQIINSSYTTISNNSALQVFFISSDRNQVKRLDTVTNTRYIWLVLTSLSPYPYPVGYWYEIPAQTRYELGTCILGPLSTVISSENS